MYFTGRGAPKDHRIAARWFRAAAEQGVPEAQNNLAVLYYIGSGVPVDYRQAVYWAQRGAKQGYAVAQADLGYLYEQGRGVPLDYETAYMWYTVAAAGGFKKSVAPMKSLASLMRPQQIANAKARASAWRPIHEKATPASERQQRTATSFLPELQGIRDF